MIGKFGKKLNFVDLFLVVTEVDRLLHVSRLNSRLEDSQARRRPLA
jgi:hypothetical protein